MGKTYIADFSITKNDMIWRCHLFIDGEHFPCYWRGYNDDNWWENVSKSCEIIDVTGSRGTKKKFQIDFKTADVWEVD